VRSNSAWGDNQSEDHAQDLTQFLRSPLFYAAAVVVVGVVFVIGSLDSEDWIEVGPIPSVQEEGSVRLDEGVTVYWNEGAPYGVRRERGAIRCLPARLDGHLVFVSPEASEVVLAPTEPADCRSVVPEEQP
jgi:hypothetical protein